jgi:hypothetical protein
MEYSFIRFLVSNLLFIESHLSAIRIISHHKSIPYD